MPKFRNLCFRVKRIQTSTPYRQEICPNNFMKNCHVQGPYCTYHCTGNFDETHINLVTHLISRFRTFAWCIINDKTDNFCSKIVPVIKTNFNMCYKNNTISMIYERLGSCYIMHLAEKRLIWGDWSWKSQMQRGLHPFLPKMSLIF